ncbi:NAD(P)/FAD-dependent oxidoreductase [Microvirga roseola]|uniref:NAD(P)/FAD-dependent oxidoreductase n=1 Tax=Microvirga roseola TaxID=2883126 RepID=UPI001E2C85EC|nr:NAD(P)/FAD-dependent oxidoreductase [Microvirga roseola]
MTASKTMGEDLTSVSSAARTDGRKEPVAAEAKTPVPHVVVVGAGFGGLAAAQELGSAPVRVTVVDGRNYHLFQPLLYQVATAALSPGEVAEPIRKILRRHRNITVLLGHVEDVDTDRREVRVNGKPLAFDYLVLATGAAHSYFGHPEWEEIAPGLKTLEDARRIRAQVLLAFEQAEMEDDPQERERLMTMAVIGGGPTGVEMAGALAELARLALARDFRNIDPTKARILLLEAGPRILSPFPKELSAYAERALQKLGVTVKAGEPVEDISHLGVTVGGRLIPAATIIWGAGVAASPVGRWLKVETDKAGRVPVAPDLSVPGLKNVFVLGDAALARDEKDKPLPGLAQVAHQQGRYLGKALLARIAEGKPMPPFRYRSRGNLAVIGRNSAVIEFDSIELKGFLAWMLWGIIHVYLLVGFQNRLLVTLRWLWAYLTFQRGARIISEGQVGGAARNLARR